MIPVVEQLKTELHDQPANPLRPRQIQDYQDEMTQLNSMAEGRDLDGVKRDFLTGAKGAARRGIQRITKILADQAPKKITGERASTVHRLVKETLETVIRPAMLPRSALRRNPPGAVGHLLRTEFNPVFKDGMLAVKRGLRALDPDNADPDFTNLERFRPEGIGDGVSTFMPDAQIPGVFGMSAAAKANWPLEDPPNTPVAQAQRREAGVRPSAPPTPATAAQPKPSRSPAQIAATARMKAGLAAKKARRAQTS